MLNLNLYHIDTQATVIKVAVSKMHSVSYFVSHSHIVFLFPSSFIVSPKRTLEQVFYNSVGLTVS